MRNNNILMFVLFLNFLIHHQMPITFLLFCKIVCLFNLPNIVILGYIIYIKVVQRDAMLFTSDNDFISDNHFIPFI